MDDLPFGWPGEKGNAAADRLSHLSLSKPANFSSKRAVAKEIVTAIKAVVTGVEGVHEALLKALDRGEVRGKEGAEFIFWRLRRREQTTAKHAALFFLSLSLSLVSTPITT